MKNVDTILQLFSNKKCCGCGQQGYFFCPQCRENLFRYSPYCYVCKKHSDNFMLHPACKSELPLEQVIVITRYKIPAIKKLLTHAKYYGKHQIYKDIIPQDISNFTDSNLSVESYLVPIPMHFLRRWKRGYNHTEKIAQVVSQITGVPVEKSLVKKKKYTKHQSKLPRFQRLVNLKNSYTITKKTQYENERIYLVDDVVSSASTLREVALCLQEKGYKDIRAIVIASD